MERIDAIRPILEKYNIFLDKNDANKN